MSLRISFSYNCSVRMVPVHLGWIVTGVMIIKGVTHLDRDGGADLVTLISKSCVCWRESVRIYYV